jgi:hypothetical protein
VEAKTKDTGAKTTFLLSYHDSATVSPESTDITVIYELKLEGSRPAVLRLGAFRRNTRAGAKGLYVDGGANSGMGNWLSGLRLL